MENENIICHGGCHCGRVRITVNVPRVVKVQECNCSICEKSGFLHLIVESKDMELISGAEDLTEYRFNTGVARHLFCRHCGIKTFYIPRSHPDGYSVNLNCLDPQSGIQFKREQFDGRHWEENIDDLIGG